MTLRPRIKHEDSDSPSPPPGSRRGPSSSDSDTLNSDPAPGPGPGPGRAASHPNRLAALQAEENFAREQAQQGIVRQRALEREREDVSNSLLVFRV